MGQILRNWRVITATLFSVALIFGAYVLARGFGSPQVAEASAETALLQAIATKDSSGDGLPDWEKMLYGIPVNATTTDYFNLGMTDGEAVAKGLIVPKAIADVPIKTSSSPPLSPDGSLAPVSDDTLTATFAKTFFALYVTAKEANGGTALSEAQTSELVNQAVSSLSSTVTATPHFKSVSDLRSSGSGADALKTFAEEAEAIFAKNTADATMNELIYLQLVVENNDANALASLVSISKAYRNAAVGLAALSTPAELLAANTAIVNAMMRVSEITSDFARVNTDSLTTMLALQQYVPAANALVKAFSDAAAVYKAVGVTITAGAPGVSFTDTANAMAARQKAIENKP